MTYPPPEGGPQRLPGQLPRNARLPLRTTFGETAPRVARWYHVR